MIKYGRVLGHSYSRLGGLPFASQMARAVRVELTPPPSEGYHGFLHHIAFASWSGLYLHPL